MVGGGTYLASTLGGAVTASKADLGLSSVCSGGVGLTSKVRFSGSFSMEQRRRAARQQHSSRSASRSHIHHG